MATHFCFQSLITLNMYTTLLVACQSVSLSEQPNTVFIYQIRVQNTTNLNVNKSSTEINSCHQLSTVKTRLMLNRVQKIPLTICYYKPYV
jgi:hypothetical protein